MTTNIGHVYEGYWNRSLKDGVGILTQTNGNYYIGQFKNGNKHGYGKEVYNLLYSCKLDSK